jgi:V/A-type H+-transporting ATPase subunit K
MKNGKKEAKQVGAEIMKKRLYEFVAISVPFMIIAAIIIGGLISTVYAQGSSGTAVVQEPEPKEKEGMLETNNMIIIAIAVMIAMAMVSASYAVGKVGSAALGAASEKPELFGRSILFVGLAEGIAIWGFVVSILLYSKLKM